MMKKLFRYGIIALITGSFIGGVLLVFLYNQLPAVDSLKDIQLQVPLRILSEDNKLIAEFGEKRRTPVAIEDVPDQLIQAFLTTEDRRFYQHGGVDLRGLMRASVHLLTHGNKGQGGSTITMQVARNFFLSRKKTYSRKLNEILLAIKIEQELTKNEILALYLNKVFLGYRAYGVAAAAQVYYGKPLSELTLAQNALLAGLPKAPSALNPIASSKASIKRRRVVLEGMLQQGVITQAEYDTAYHAPVTARYHGTKIQVKAPYVAEMVRKELLNRYGSNAYTLGLQVHTTINSELQTFANNALTNGLLAYDQRHGIRKLPTLDTNNPQKALRKIPHFGKLFPAIVTQVTDNNIEITIKKHGLQTVSWQEMAWARRDLGKLRVSYFPKKPSDIVKIGNLIYVYQVSKNTWRLGQVPEAEGALVSMSPKNGAIKALVGGFDFVRSKFNRVTQTELQPGSNFKPFIYTAALAAGFTPTSMINDAPIVFSDPSEEALWRPQNDNKVFNGPTTLRTGLVRSRNLVSIRLLNAVGIEKTIDYLTRFGFTREQMPQALSLALGTAAVSPLDIARGYSVFANGGQLVQPHFIKQIDNANGESIWQQEAIVACGKQCDKPNMTNAETVIDPRDAYIMTNLLQDAVQRGTARGLKDLKRHDLAAKTGTTNDQYDAWFSGYNRSLVTTVWLGFDNPRSLGEYAASAALPVWKDFMRHALKNKPDNPPLPPEGVITVKIDPENGLLANSQQQDAILEVFRLEDAPKQISTRKRAPKNQKTPAAADNNDWIF